MTTTLNRQNPDDANVDILARALGRVYTLNWEAITYIVIFAFAVFTRFFMLGERAMSHDESLHTRYSYNLAVDGNFQHTPLMHGPVLFHFTALFYFLFGANDFTSRLYTAILGVAIVMMPLLFRRWLGKWGAILASIMLLISPITMYYHRYIRHDTPNIFFSLLMIYGIFMYLSGPEGQRRREHWLYLIAGAMLLNLGSKETAFIYVAIMGLYIAAYWFVRLFQYYRGTPGKTPFYTLMMAFGVGGVAALGMYITLSINLGEQPFFTAISTLGSTTTFTLWTLAVIVAITLLVALTLLTAFNRSPVQLGAAEGLLFFGISFVVSTILIIAEELSRIPSDEAAEVVNVSIIPVIGAWVVAAIAIGAILVAWNIGLWNTMKERFPEFDLLILIGTLILPWASPIFIKLSGVHMTVQDMRAYDTFDVVIVVMATLAMFAISFTAGLLWNWRKWLISMAIFYALFFFFFTTMLTNGAGVGTGLIGSLGYWLEQQGVRRGSQPQYYYLGVILPMYEYLPIIGSVAAMFGGLTWFWRFRRTRLEEGREAALELLDQNEYNPIGDGNDRAEWGTDYEQGDEVVIATSDQSDQVAFEATEPKTTESQDSVYDASADWNYEPIDAQPQAVASTSAEPKRSPTDPEFLGSLPFLPFVAWWAILNLIGYTLAGEKMPWLAIHMALPMILLSGWFFGRIFQRIDVKKLLPYGWAYLILVPTLVILVARIFGPIIFGENLLTGLDVNSLRLTGQWLGVVLATGAVIFGLFWLSERTGFDHLRRMSAVAIFGLLSILTLRTAWMASFINFDLANEYLVYAHAAPAVKLVLDDIEDLSRRSTDGLDLAFVYDNEVSWPYSWYFREFNNATYAGESPNAQMLDNAVVAVVGEANRSKFEPLLDDNYFRREYIRLWWPMQDYFNMTPSRLGNTFQPTADSAQVRRGLWDIWWARDFEAYGEATNRDFSLTGWPVSDRMHVYVRKDFAAQIWDLGIGEGTVPGLTEVAVNMCNANWQQGGAELVFGETNLTEGLLAPVDLSVANGRVYVAEQGAHRISVFDTDGNYIESFGQQGSALNATGQTGDHTQSLGLLERPNSVSVADNGNVYVADTWNFRVQQFTEDGEAVDAFGTRYEQGAASEVQPLDGFWAPRKVLASDSRVFVADTGNKRIRVYNLDGDFLYDIGSAGSEEGNLEEPAGLTLGDDGRLYVVDTWNRRISVFRETGEFEFTFRVRAWYNDRGNRPYVAVDSERGFVYVTDPEAARVLVYDTEGNCLGSFGQPAPEGSIGNNQFRVAAGIALDEDGNVYVSDTDEGRIVKYAPFDPPPMPEQAASSDDVDADNVQVGITAELTVELTEEVIQVDDPANEESRDDDSNQSIPLQVVPQDNLPNDDESAE